jgi:phospholipase/carboxylesterase
MNIRIISKGCTKCAGFDVCRAMHYVTRRPQLSSSPLLETEGQTIAGKPPVLVVLHGYGTDENDLLPIAEKIGPQFLILSLQAPIELHNGGHAWYDLLQTPSGIIPDDLTRHESEEELLQSLAGIIMREGGDTNRVVLLGFSQGAAVIYSLLAVCDLKNYGITPIASINMSGYLPRDILEALSEKRFDGFPFFISHGEFDELIPPQALAEAEKLLTQQGADVTARMYQCGHGVLPQTVEEIISWLPKITIYELRITN